MNVNVSPVVLLQDINSQISSEEKEAPHHSMDDAIPAFTYQILQLLKITGGANIPKKAKRNQKERQ
ncbi:MAG: hypothetical protein V3T17_03010 [Pseudomonadales bacterium]